MKEHKSSCHEKEKKLKIAQGTLEKRGQYSTKGGGKKKGR